MMRISADCAGGDVKFRPSLVRHRSFIGACVTQMSRYSVDRVSPTVFDSADGAAALAT